MRTVDVAKYASLLAPLLLMQLPIAAQNSDRSSDNPSSAEQQMHVERFKEIPYVESATNRQVLDLYLPGTCKNPPPLVVWIHGGGYSKGDKSVLVPAFLVKYGYALACIDYRYSTDAPFPAQLFDCKAAIRFLRANANKYGFDGSRIAVFGASSGGNLAALVGTATGMSSMEGGSTSFPNISTEVQAVIDWSGITDIPSYYVEDPIRHGMIEQLLNGTPTQKAELARMASPVNFACKGQPPFLIMHGDADDVVPASQSEELYQALKTAGVEVDLHIIAGGNHFLANPDNAKIVIDFLDKHLKRKNLDQENH